MGYSVHAVGGGYDAMVLNTLPVVPKIIAVEHLTVVHDELLRSAPLDGHGPTL